MISVSYLLKVARLMHQTGGEGRPCFGGIDWDYRGCRGGSTGSGDVPTEPVLARKSDPAPNDEVISLTLHYVETTDGDICLTNQPLDKASEPPENVSASPP